MYAGLEASPRDKFQTISQERAVAFATLLATSQRKELNPIYWKHHLPRTVGIFQV
jgi:hypothetical protein